MPKYTAWAYSEAGEDYTYIGTGESVEQARELCEDRAGTSLRWEQEDSRWAAYRMNTSPAFVVKEARND